MSVKKFIYITDSYVRYTYKHTFGFVFTYVIIKTCKYKYFYKLNNNPKLSVSHMIKRKNYINSFC